MKKIESTFLLLLLHYIEHSSVHRFRLREATTIAEMEAFETGSTFNTNSNNVSSIFGNGRILSSWAKIRKTPHRQNPRNPAEDLEEVFQLLLIKNYLEPVCSRSRFILNLLNETIRSCELRNIDQFFLGTIRYLWEQEQDGKNIEPDPRLHAERFYWEVITNEPGKVKTVLDFVVEQLAPYFDVQPTVEDLLAVLRKLSDVEGSSSCSCPKNCENRHPVHEKSKSASRSHHEHQIPILHQKRQSEFVLSISKEVQKMNKQLAKVISTQNPSAWNHLKNTLQVQMDHFRDDGEDMEAVQLARLIHVDLLNRLITKTDEQILLNEQNNDARSRFASHKKPDDDYVIFSHTESCDGTLTKTVKVPAPFFEGREDLVAASREFMNSQSQHRALSGPALCREVLLQSSSSVNS